MRWVFFFPRLLSLMHVDERYGFNVVSSLSSYHVKDYCYLFVLLTTMYSSLWHGRSISLTLLGVYFLRVRNRCYWHLYEDYVNYSEDAISFDRYLKMSPRPLFRRVRVKSKYDFLKKKVASSARYVCSTSELSPRWRYFEFVVTLKTCCENSLS